MAEGFRALTALEQALREAGEDLDGKGDRANEAEGETLHFYADLCREAAHRLERAQAVAGEARRNRGDLWVFRLAQELEVAADEAPPPRVQLHLDREALAEVEHAVNRACKDAYGTNQALNRALQTLKEALGLTDVAAPLRAEDA